MILRSGFIYNGGLIILPLNIDFDHASKMWRKNKIYLGNGMFTYINEAKTFTRTTRNSNKDKET